MSEALQQKSEKAGKSYRFCLAGEGKINDIQHAIKFGIDCFEVSYPFTLASQEKALIYNS